MDDFYGAERTGATQQGKRRRFTEQESRLAEANDGDLATIVESLLGALATRPRVAAAVCNADGVLYNLCAQTSVPVTEGLVRQQVNLIDLPRLYQPDGDVVRCALWRWVAAFSSVAHEGVIADRDAPPALAAMYALGRGTYTGDVAGEHGADGGMPRRWDLALLGGDNQGEPWPSPLAAMAYEWVPRNDLLLWATLSPATVRTLPPQTEAMLVAASTVADAVRGDADLETDAVLDADSVLCSGGRLFAIMNVVDRARQWGLPERERVDSLPDDGAIATLDEAREVDRRAAETGDPVEALTVRVFGPPPHIEYDQTQGDDSDGDDDVDDGGEPRTRWVMRLPGPPVDPMRLAEVGLWAPILAAAVHEGETAEALYRVLTSEPFVDLAIGTINDTVQRLSAPAIEARGDDIPSECAQAAAAPVGILPMEVYATYLADDGTPQIVLWVRPIMDATLVDPDGRDWWQQP
ncbi:hypothetical protein TW95_gp1638 [Pandoravirus inopinatum]|uniref:Uncharacterized protein n=1 Tax=Pandoravirus inopinatum TaxID=1605721 RepID=A0A0B5JEX9_9VIRU|nr:hypothetical protein TW95_gp1638 [Pandoravirus inopinatum]AJF98372.1 hypothetical protein [Pandoravirus inopinatum]